jgi:hypothetical protein
MTERIRLLRIPLQYRGMARPFPWWMLLALAGWAFLLFARLGHYALWDDESLMALDAEGIQRTGDTTVLLGPNIVAYRNGLCIRDFADRSTPPLSAYLTAASFDLFGVSPFTARLPFALLGLGAGALLLLWARDAAPAGRWVFLAALFGNVSLILFCRQCRYYSPAIFFSLAIVFVAWRWRPGAKELVVLAVLSASLFATNEMNYVALYVTLVYDYVFWRRKERPLGWRDAALLVGVQALLIAPVAAIWNPFRTSFGGYESANRLADHLKLFLWCWRDLDRCEFFALPLVLLALGVGLMWRRKWLVRGCLALVVYVGTIALISPQAIRYAVEAEVRYLTPILPLALVLQAGALAVLLERRRILLVIATALAFGTNLLNGGPFLAWGLRSTFLSYLGELSLPQAEPYSPTIAWIRANVPPGASVWSTPYYTCYPLMFGAPDAVYAWQLGWPPRPDFARLPAIDFLGRAAPDFIVAFGPARRALDEIEEKKLLPKVHYEAIGALPVYWQDQYRPELYWRRFESTTDFDPQKDGVFLYRKVEGRR